MCSTLDAGSCLTEVRLDNDTAVTLSCVALGIAAVLGAPFLWHAAAGASDGGSASGDPPGAAAPGEAGGAREASSPAASPEHPRSLAFGGSLSPSPASSLVAAVESDRTDANIARARNLGMQVPLVNGPCLRVTWDKAHGPDDDHLKGQVTLQEQLWGVIVTMGIAAMRDQIFVDKDEAWYILHFFCYFDPVMASIMYSTRFNDTDVFHRMLWFLFTLGMAGQCAFLYHSQWGFAACTGFLYLVILLAQLRVALYLPRARFLAMHDAFWNAVACCIFAAIFLLRGVFELPRFEYAALLLHALLRPTSFASFWWLTRTKTLKQRRDVPVNIWYMVSRFEGLFMMIILCSVLFPLGLAGAYFVRSKTSALLILAGNFWALLLKLTLFDVQEWSSRELDFHALRHRSRKRALTYLVVFPYGVLGIALTGVGLVAAGKGMEVPMTRSLLCGGGCLTWAILALSEACHSDRLPLLHCAKVLGQFFGAALCLVPRALDFGVGGTVCWLLVVMILIFLGTLVPECVKVGGVPAGWQWRPMEHWKAAGPTPTGVSSNEHFFTVFLSVAVWQMNMDLGATHDVPFYMLRFSVFYGAIWATMRYAAAFRHEDGSHKLMWCLFELALLYMLEGLSASSVDQGNLFELTVVVMFLVLAVCFSARGLTEKSVQCYWGFFTLVHLACAAMVIASLLGVLKGAQRFVVASLLLWSDATFSLLTAGRFADQESMNCEYVTSRFNSLFMEVLGVAVIVPNAVYPGSYEHPWLVGLGDAIAVKIAVSIKAVIFDVEPIKYELHAINRGPVRRFAYLAMNICILFALSLFGASLPLLIASSGNDGPQSRSGFAQTCACLAGFLLWAGLAVTKYLHRFYSARDVHVTKAGVLVIGACLSLLPLALPIGDFACLCMVATAAQIVEWTQYWRCLGALASLLHSPWW